MGRAVTIRFNEQLVSRIRKLDLKKGWGGAVRRGLEWSKEGYTRSMRCY